MWSKKSPQSSLKYETGVATASKVPPMALHAFPDMMGRDRFQQGPTDMRDLKTLLRDLHQNMLRAQDQKSAMEEGARLLKKLQLRLEHQKQHHQGHLDAIKNLKKGIHDNEVTIKAQQQLVDKYERQRNEVASKKELDALQEEIKQTRERIATLEDQTLDAMTQLDEKLAATPQFEQQVKLAEDELRKHTTEQGTRRLDREKLIAQADAAAKICIEELPADIKGDVARLLKAKGIDGMAQVAKKSCSGCYTDLSAQRQMDLQQGKLLYCHSCGRLLYPMEEEKAE